MFSKCNQKRLTKSYDQKLTHNKVADLAKNLNNRLNLRGATENARNENSAPSKIQVMKIRDMKMRHHTAWHENTRHENAAPQCVA